jgi:hypothetical protein
MHFAYYQMVVCVSGVSVGTYFYLKQKQMNLLPFSLSLYTRTGTGAFCHILSISHQSSLLLGPFSSCAEDSSAHLHLL